MTLKRDENGVPLTLPSRPSPASMKEPIDYSVYEDKDLKYLFDKNAAADARNNQKNTVTSERQSGIIGEEEIAKAMSKLQRWMQSKKVYDVRYKNNFDSYMLVYNENDNPDTYKDENGSIREKLITTKRGAQALNVIMNKHADAMDNYPEAVCLPRSADDEDTAKILNSILPCILERNKFQKTYSKSWTNKLVGGTGGYSVLWDKNAENGLGDISINKLDILTLVWQPFIEDIQDSSDLFCIKLYDIEEVKEVYPELADVGSASSLDVTEFTTYDNSNKKDGKAAVVDWYYKKDGVLHMCKFCGSTILFASENDPENYPKGFYEHGKYPFVIDPMFYMPDTPVGFSFIDICRWNQKNIDNLKSDLLKNVHVNSQTRNLVDSSSNVNIDDLSDLSKDFIEGDNIERATKPLETKNIAAGALNVYNALVDEIKETTGTNDASNGAGAAGVTSGSAIAALQEAGGKISRDANKGGYSAFVEVCEMVIELMRQFYTLPRYFRIVGENNKTEYVSFDNSGLRAQPIDTQGISKDIFTTEQDASGIFERVPIFDIKVKAQKQSPFAVAANNEMMMNMFKMGMFRAENADSALIALEGMTFEGKDKLVTMIKEYKSLSDTCNELYNKLQMTSAMLASNEAQNIGVQPGYVANAPQPEAAV